MKLHDERYVLSVAASHKAVRLRDHQTGEIHEWTGTRALYDALGVLAEWRERDANAHKAHYGVPSERAHAGGNLPCDICVGRCTIDGGCTCPPPYGSSTAANPFCPVHRNPDYGAPNVNERPMHFGDHSRTACGKWSGMVYQYTSDRKAVTCGECRNAGQCTCPLGPEDAHFPGCPMYDGTRCPTCGVTGGMPHDCETAGRIS